MATLFISSPSPSSWARNQTQFLPSSPNLHYPFSLSFSKPTKSKKLRFCAQNERERETISVAVVDEKSKEEDTQKRDEGEKDELNEERGNQQELDWKTDEEFKKFMGNPSIEAAIKLEKKRADRKLKELDAESNSGNPVVGLFSRIARENLMREKERLEKAEEAFRALDLNKIA